MNRLKAVLAIALALCLAVFVAGTMRWPFVYDAALIRYANFLMQHHLAPYRDIQDYNLPGSYFFDWLVTHTLGLSALAWRIYDLLLTAIAGIAIFRIARPYSRFAGFFAAAMFALFHARDGIGQSGQRDLLITTLVLLGITIALRRSSRPSLNAALFGLSIGIAATVKPTAIVALPLLLLTEQPKRWRTIAATLAGFLVAPIAALLWLWHMHALAAFWRTLTQMIPLHARLGNLGLWPLFTRCLTASHLTLLILALLLAFTTHEPALRRLRPLLGAGMLYGLISYFVQAKGYPDHRYPFAAFLFLFAAVEFTCALRSPGYRRCLGILGLVFGTVLSALSMVRAVRDRWPAEPVASLTRDLNALGGPALSGRVQCFDTIDGCIETLYNMRLVQSTGFVYDEFLFADPNSLTPRERPIQATLRNDLLHQLTAAPPQAIIVTPRLFPLGPDRYAKLDRWAALTGLLDHCYHLQAQRDFPIRHSYDRGYRLYSLQPACSRQ